MITGLVPALLPRQLPLSPDDLRDPGTCNPPGSRLEDVAQGLHDLRRVIQDLAIRSIAIPPLGCGNGGLDWKDVHPLVLGTLADLPDVDVHVYSPQGAPPPEEMPNNQEPPNLNRERSAFLVALDRYMGRGLANGFTMERKATLLETHKLIYLLQNVGYSLNLQFAKGHYGPYSVDLDRALASLEGHFILGYGDGTGGASALLTADSESVKHATEFVRGDIDFSRSIDRLDQVVDGYEHPYGMELLGTTLFASQHLGRSATIESVVTYVQEWTPRKQRMFTATHLSAAWQRLADCSLLASTP